MVLLTLAALIGLIPAFIAHKKGHSFMLWWIYGAALLIVALPHALIMKTDVKALERKQLADGMKKCPFCAELIKGEAAVCRHCGRGLKNDLKKIAASTEEPQSGDLVCSNCDYIVGLGKSPKHTFWGELICPVCNEKKFYRA